MHVDGYEGPTGTTDQFDAKMKVHDDKTLDLIAETIWRIAELGKR